MASHAQDDGFREIQLNGKQLVFVFMATTVVLVVTFLCGVLVGRGVRNERADIAQVTGPSADDQLRSAVETAKPPTVQQAEDPTKAPPPAPAEGGGSTEGASETSAIGGAALVSAAKAAKDDAAVKAGSSRPDAAKAGPSKPEPPKSEAAKAEPPKPASAKPEPGKAEVARNEPTKPTAARAEPPKSEPEKPDVRPETAKSDSAKAPVPAASDNRSGWVVQVAAVKTRGEADSIVKRLSSKGYSAFVLANSANVFRVRVGGYPSKRDADTVAAKLRKEERVSPWVTR